jgi:hypothetical protein
MPIGCDAHKDRRRCADARLAATVRDNGITAPHRRDGRAGDGLPPFVDDLDRRSRRAPCRVLTQKHASAEERHGYRNHPGDDSVDRHPHVLECATRRHKSCVVE